MGVQPRVRPFGPRTTTLAPSASWPSRKIVAETVKSSPTTALAGNWAPAVTAGPTPTMGKRPVCVPGSKSSAAGLWARAGRDESAAGPPPAVRRGVATRLVPEPSWRPDALSGACGRGGSVGRGGSAGPRARLSAGIRLAAGTQAAGGTRTAAGTGAADWGGRPWMSGGSWGWWMCCERRATAANLLTSVSRVLPGSGLVIPAGATGVRGMRHAGMAQAPQCLSLGLSPGLSPSMSPGLSSGCCPLWRSR